MFRGACCEIINMTTQCPKHIVHMASAKCPVELFWSLRVGLQGLCAEDTASSVQSVLQKAVGMDMNHACSKLQKFLPSLQRRYYYGNVLFPDAFETIDARVMF